MSFASSLNREVTLTPRAATGSTDARGNDVIAEGTPVSEVKCRRELVEGSEDIVDQQRVVRRFLYFFGPSVSIDERTLITDGPEDLEVEVVDGVDGRTTLHHYEVQAKVVEG